MTSWYVRERTYSRSVECHETQRASSVIADDLQRRLQAFFCDGVVTIIGLGHSASHGLPTMPDLAEGLRTGMATELTPAEAAEWKPVEAMLDEGHHLEAALDAISHESPILERIINASAKLILAAERPALDRLARGEDRFPLAELLPKLAVGGTARVITTNYDRLVELAAEISGLFLDTGFVGSHYAACDPALSHESLRSAILKRGRKQKFEYRPHVVLDKPHGSLDWYLHDETPIRSPYELGLPRLMITPGQSKYHRGYEQPFDHHISNGNQAVDRASGIIAIGFGFNDPHLQKHLEPRIRQGLPCLIITRSLTEAATALLQASPNVIAVERLAPDGTRIHTPSGAEEFPASNLWQLGDFIDEVLT